LLAGMLLPWLGGTGMLVRQVKPAVLPPDLSDSLPGNTRVLAADGSLLTMFYTNDRVPVPGDRIPDVMKQAQVDIEDSRFYEHRGLDE